MRHDKMMRGGIAYYCKIRVDCLMSWGIVIIAYPEQCRYVERCRYSQVDDRYALPPSGPPRFKAGERKEEGY